MAPLSADSAVSDLGQWAVACEYESTYSRDNLAE